MREYLQKYLDKGRLYVSIPEFCRMMNWTTPTYYKLRSIGQTPAETRVPGLTAVRISIEEIDRWMTARENPSPAEKVVIAEQKAKRKQLSDIAVAGLRREA